MLVFAYSLLFSPEFSPRPEFSRQILMKSANIKLHESSSVRAELSYTNGQVAWDMTNLLMVLCMRVKIFELSTW